MIYSEAPIADMATSVDIVKDTDNDAFFFRELEKAGIKLNKKQTEAVRFEDGACVVISPAGAGKTNLLTNRVNRLITVNGVDPSKILLFTFTNKIAKEMIERLSKLPFMSKEIASKVKSGTFHSVFLSILREHGDKRTIWSSSKSKEITLKTICRKMGIEKFYEPENILAKISNYKNNLIDIDEVPNKELHEKEFIHIWKEYEEFKQKHGYIDFDDMLYDVYKLFKEKPDILEKIRNRYDYILIDEYQDSNRAHDVLVEMIAYPKNNIFVVGDFRQCIYSFAGSRIENILNFNKRYPNAKTISLEINYRSTNWIIGLGTYIINKYGQKFDNTITKSVKPSDMKPKIIRPLNPEIEAIQIVREIRTLTESGKYKLGDIAILYRTNSNARSIYEELLMNNINFISYNNDEIFYENTYVKPLIEYLRLSYEPSNLKAIETILPTMMIGKDKMDYINIKQFENPISNPITYLLKSDLKPFHRSKVEERLRLIERIVNVRPLIAIRALRKPYEEFLFGDSNVTTTTLVKEIIKETLDELESSCRKFNTNREFVEYIDNLIKSAQIQKNLQKKGNYDGVKIMTIHRSKGMEFPVVFGISLVDGVLPHVSSLEECTDIISAESDPISEENRLLYVLVTRAMQELTLSIPRTFRGRDAKPSRFLEELINDDSEDELYG